MTTGMANVPNFDYRIRPNFGYASCIRFKGKPQSVTGSSFIVLKTETFGKEEGLLGNFCCLSIDHIAYVQAGQELGLEGKRFVSLG